MTLTGTHLQRIAVALLFFLLPFVHQASAGEAWHSEGNSPYLISMLDPSALEKAAIQRPVDDSMERELYFAANASLFPGLEQHDQKNRGIFTAWQDRVFDRLKVAYPKPLEMSARYCVGLDCPAAYLAPLDEWGTVSRLISRETLQFARENAPEIERVLALLRLDVNEGSRHETGEEPAAGDPASAPSAGGKTFSLQTLFRLKMSSGNISPVVEAHASYLGMNSYVRVNLLNTNSAGLGVQYPLASNSRIEVEREAAAHSDPVLTGTSGKTDKTLLRFVLAF